jgi:hypothetical protein
VQVNKNPKNQNLLSSLLLSTSFGGFFPSVLPLFGNQVDRLLAFIDLDPSLVSEEARTALSSRLEAVAMQQDQFLILFAKEEDRVVELSLAASSSYLGPRCLFIKQLHTSAKVSSCGRSWNCC